MNQNRPNISQVEEAIIKELIKNPRISDNQISKKTNIPVMTVNRKRKAMEGAGLISYYATVKKHQEGYNIFNVRQLYIIKLKAGVTRTEYMEAVEMDPKIKLFNSTFISTTFIGEKDGHLALIVILDAKSDARLMEEFNGKIISLLKTKFGTDAIQEITTARINDTVRIHHNYLPNLNMKAGIIKEDWPEDYIFVHDEKKVQEQIKNLKSFVP